MTEQVAAVTHEADAYLYYAPVDTDGDQLTDYDGMDPYWAMSSMVLGAFDGFHEIEGVEINGERWDIQAKYSKSGFTPRPEHDVDGDRLYEFEINARGRGERKCSYNISPRYEGMLNSDGEPTTTAFSHTEPDEGLSVHCQPSNMRLDEVPALLPRFVAELAEAAGTRMYHGYFQQPFDGRLNAVERYVRLFRQQNEKVIAKDGVLHRIAMFLSDIQGTEGVLKWDNVEERGHHIVLRHGSESARQMCSQHRLGGQIKSYLPQNPEHFEEGEALHEPKIGVKYTNGRTDGSAVPWNERDEAISELDERLLSLLSWADVPTEADTEVYVPDDHFKARRRASTVPIRENPLPRLEAEKDHILMATLGSVVESDEEILRTLATDGGRHARELAEETGYSLSTIYRTLQRVPEVIESDRGHVQFVSEKLRQEIREIVETFEQGLDTAAERVGRLLDVDVRQSASSAFDRWAAKYGGEFVPPSETGRPDDRPVVRIDTVLSELKTTARPLVDEALHEMLAAWDRDGRDVLDLRRAIVQLQVDGDRRETTVGAIA